MTVNPSDLAARIGELYGQYKGVNGNIQRTEEALNQILDMSYRLAVLEPWKECKMKETEWIKKHMAENRSITKSDWKNLKQYSIIYNELNSTRFDGVKVPLPFKLQHYRDLYLGKRSNISACTIGQQITWLWHRNLGAVVARLSGK